MAHAETRILGYGVAGSLAMHLLLFCSLAIWVGFEPMQKIIKAIPEPEPVVTMVFPENIEVPPPEPPKPKEDAKNYIRTTQNEPATAAPAKANFISDRNTVAAAKLPADAKGDVPLPTMNGINIPTADLADRDYKDGKIKNDSAPPSPKPEAKPSEPKIEKPPVIARKEDAPAEKMMKELDEKLKDEGTEHLPIDLRRPPDVPDTPQMKLPDESRAPKAIPVASTPRPEKDSYVPDTRRSKTSGTISNLGSADSVDAAETAAGRYMHQVHSAVGVKWHMFSRRYADYFDPGKLRLHISVDKNGRVRIGDIKIIFSEANPRVTDLSMRAILEAEIPPIPPDLLQTLDKERFETDFDFVIY